jgi:hypothetical protein
MLLLYEYNTTIDVDPILIVTVLPPLWLQFSQSILATPLHCGFVRVVLTANSGQAVSNMASIFESKVGKGSLIVSGLDLDLNECNETASLPPSERQNLEPSGFSRWLSTALVDAAVERVTRRFVEGS